jgi:hypothetical protein
MIPGSAYASASSMTTTSENLDEGAGTAAPGDEVVIGPREESSNGGRPCALLSI